MFKSRMFRARMFGALYFGAADVNHAGGSLDGSLGMGISFSLGL